MVARSDAGEAGADARQQSGLVIMWGVSIIVWRSSTQTVSTLSTVEAELNAATSAWQIFEGARLLVSDLGFQIPSVRLLLDNGASITIASCGAT